jgi:hypothetical protein
MLKWSNNNEYQLSVTSLALLNIDYRYAQLFEVVCCVKEKINKILREGVNTTKF